MAADRRIITGTHVSPQKYATKTIPLKASSSRGIAAIEGTLENVDQDKAAYTKSTSEVASSTYNKYIIDSAVGKSLGGHSSSPNHIANNLSQDWDGWTSMEHPQMYWEAHNATDADGSSGDIDGKWDSATTGAGIRWDGTALISTSVLTPSAQTEDMVYCYIKNVGSTAIYVSLNGGTKYQIKISPGAAFNCRGHGNTEANDIRIKTLSSTSYAEFVIAI
jgi:hypothetical protein